MLEQFLKFTYSREYLQTSTLQRYRGMGSSLCKMLSAIFFNSRYCYQPTFQIELNYHLLNLFFGLWKSIIRKALQHHQTLHSVSLVWSIILKEVRLKRRGWTTTSFSNSLSMDPLNIFQNPLEKLGRSRQGKAWQILFYSKDRFHELQRPPPSS